MKAYAKYYSTYESLFMSNEIDFLQELTANPIQTLKINHENIETIANKIQSFDMIGLVEDENHQLHPIRKEEFFTY